MKQCQRCGFENEEKVEYCKNCGASFKDWYIAEGGSEGPRKLQGYKAPDRQHAQRKANEMALELKAFLGRLPGDIFYEKGSVKIYFPVMTSIVISAVLTVLVNLFVRR